MEKPQKKIFTIYTKKNCLYCDLSKEIFINTNTSFHIVNCDNYLLDDREAFLLFIKELCGKEHKTFPIIFLNSLFVGGYIELQELLLNDF